MAIAHVQNTSTDGSTAQSEITGLETTGIGNVVVMFASQTASVLQPTPEDSSGKGKEGWTLVEKAEGNGSTSSCWAWIKKVTETFTSVKVVKATGGTIQGVAFIEISGASTTTEVASKVSNAGSVKTFTSASTTTTDAGDIILGFAGGQSTGTMGAPEAWTGSNEVMTLIRKAAVESRAFGGYNIPGSTVSGRTYSPHWATTRQAAGVFFAIKPAAAEGGGSGAFMVI